MESNVNDNAHLAPTPRISSGDVFAFSILTATIGFSSSTALSISHATQPDLCVFLPMMHKKTSDVLIRREIARLTGVASVLFTEISTDVS